MLSFSPQAVLFDLDGVLIDSRRAWHQTIDSVARSSGHPAVSWERFASTFGQGVEADRDSFFPRLAVDEVNRRYEQTFASHLDAVALMPGAIELLDQLADKKIRRAVVTNTPLALAQAVLARKGIATRVETLAAAGEADEKPSPALIELALARLGLACGEVVYVGDSASDQGAARSAGVLLVGFGGLNGDLSIESLSELLPHLSGS